MAEDTQGAQLQVEDPETPATFIPVAGLKSLAPPSPTKDEIDTTDLDSTAKESIPGLIDYGTLAVSGNAEKDDAGQDLARGDANNASAPVRNFKIIFPKLGVQYTFSAWVKSWVIKAETNAAYQVDGQLRCTGPAVESAYVAP
jgi:hypothetical protein